MSTGLASPPTIGSTDSCGGVAAGAVEVAIADDDAAGETVWFPHAARTRMSVIEAEISRRMARDASRDRVEGLAGTLPAEGNPCSTA